MMYDTMAHPPRPGSLLEILFTMIQMKRDAARLMETRVIVQALRDDDTGDATGKAFEDYRRALLPYSVEEERESTNTIIEALDREFNMGPMAVKRTHSGAVRSRLSRILNHLKEAPKPRLKWRRRVR